VYLFSNDAVLNNCMLVNNELGRKQKEAVASFRIPSQDLAGGIEENPENLSQDSRCPVRDSKWASQKYNSEVLPFESSSSSLNLCCSWL
jgi:hypothetical protein